MEQPSQPALTLDWELNAQSLSEPLRVCQAASYCLPCPANVHPTQWCTPLIGKHRTCSKHLHTIQIQASLHIRMHEGVRACHIKYQRSNLAEKENQSRNHCVWTFLWVLFVASKINQWPVNLKQNRNTSTPKSKCWKKPCRAIWWSIALMSILGNFFFFFFFFFFIKAME